MTALLAWSIYSLPRLFLGSWPVGDDASEQSSKNKQGKGWILTYLDGITSQWLHLMRRGKLQSEHGSLANFIMSPSKDIAYFLEAAIELGFFYSILLRLREVLRNIVVVDWNRISSHICESEQILTRDVCQHLGRGLLSTSASIVSQVCSIFDGVGDVSTIPWTHPAKSNSFADESVAACVFTQYIIEG